MNKQEFYESLSQPTPPNGYRGILLALWYDGKGNWDAAHDIAQDDPSSAGSLMHAYLHRKEGDNWNANYWYRRAGESMPSVSLREEWEELVERFLE